MRKCRGYLMVYMDGKAEMEWACELEEGHEGHHVDGRYGWDRE